ncbi:MAG: polysaccharide deacetylase family protein [Alistipes sp.]|nr:polysaccharide deacetylase family protein [Alistipes sp.]
MFWWTVIGIFAAVAAVLVYGSVAIGSGIYVKALCRGRNAGKAVALTFDDGPHPELTPKVLDVLRRHGVRATFFVSGKNAEAYPAIVRRIAREGHLVGNHSYGHAGYFPLYGPKKMAGDIDRCSEAIQRATGGAPRYFRPPFGVTNPMVARTAHRAGLKVCGWSIRSFDTMGRPLERVLRRVTGRLHDGAVILLHDNRTGSPELTDQLLEALEKSEYRPVRLDEFDKK